MSAIFKPFRSGCFLSCCGVKNQAVRCGSSQANAAFFLASPSSDARKAFAASACLAPLGFADCATSAAEMALAVRNAMARQRNVRGMGGALRGVSERIAKDRAIVNEKTSG